MHLDQLTDKSREECVQRVIEALLGGALEHDIPVQNDEQVRDLGLIATSDDMRAPIRSTQKSSRRS